MEKSWNLLNNMTKPPVARKLAVDCISWKNHGIVILNFCGNPDYESNRAYLMKLLNQSQLIKAA